MERARFARAKISAFGSGQSAATYLVEFLTVAAGTGVAAHVEVSDNGSGPDAEDEYDALLATLGRRMTRTCASRFTKPGTLFARAYSGMMWEARP